MGVEIAGLSKFMIVDVALILGLSLGIWYKSRLCAISLLLYYVIGKIASLTAHSSSVSSIGIAIMFTIAFYKGVLGTFSYPRK
jgi:hypothetical protein